MMNEQNPELVQPLSPGTSGSLFTVVRSLCRRGCHFSDHLTSLSMGLTLDRGLSGDSRYLLVVSALQLTFCVYASYLTSFTLDFFTLKMRDLHVLLVGM